MPPAATQLDRIEAHLAEIAKLLTILVHQARSDRDEAQRSRRLQERDGAFRKNQHWGAPR